MPDISYLNHSQLTRLNGYCTKYTNFDSFEELLEANYKPVIYFEVNTPPSNQREINMIIDCYNNHMLRDFDPRRIYKC